MNDIQIMDLYNNHRNNEKIDFSGTKGRIDLIEEFNQSENKEKENDKNHNKKNKSNKNKKTITTTNQSPNFIINLDEKDE